MARAYWLQDVLADLSARGVPVHYVNGWQSRGAESFDPQGVICHDTGGSANSTDAGEIGTLLNGSTSAPAPIAQLYLSRTTGVHLVAAGRCNHALTGRAGPLAGKSNSSLIGIEAAANPGRPWPAQQYQWYVQLVAAICRRKGWNPDRNVAAHREHQPGEKVDPAGIDMTQFRAHVRALIANPQGDDMDGNQDRLLRSAEWRLHHLLQLDPTAESDPFGGTYNIPLVELLKRVDENAKAAATKPAGTVTMTAQDKADIIAAIETAASKAAEAAVRRVLGSLDGATPPPAPAA